MSIPVGALGAVTSGLRWLRIPIQSTALQSHKTPMFALFVVFFRLLPSMTLFFFYRAFVGILAVCERERERELVLKGDFCRSCDHQLCHC